MGGRLTGISSVGCATQEAPDKNDWIKDCDTQAEVYAFVTQTIEHLKGLQ